MAVPFNPFLHVKVDISPAPRFELSLEPPDEGKFAHQPLGLIQHDSTFLPDMQEAKLRIGKISDPFWWSTWFLFMSKKQIDRDDMRDLLLSKLPVAKLFAVGCVPQYSPYLFNAHINPFLEHQLKHNKEYFPSAFCIREGELDSFGVRHLVAPRQVWAYLIAKKKWVLMPSLDFLPPRVTGMLAGEGGLLLLSGDPPPYVDPLVLEKPLAETTIEEPKVKEKPNVKEGEEGDEEEEKPEVEGDGEEGEEEDGEKKKEVEKVVEKPPEKPIDPNGQHLLVVCNPISRTFRILPPMHCHLENLKGNIIVNSISSQYVVYIVGYHPRMSQCPQVEGMRVAIFKSIKNRWRIFSVPQGRLFRPGLSNCYRALPLISENIEAPTLFCTGQVLTPENNAYSSVVLGFRKKTRSWKAYSWPPPSVVEHPQVVECNHKLYIVARGVEEPITITIWNFIPHDYSIPDCQQVTKMPAPMFRKVFPYGFHIRSEYDCVSSMGCIMFACRDRAALISCYNVNKNSWSLLPELYPCFQKNLTYLGNWKYEPAAHAQV
ncbi:unnamed protein product [Sphagnum balticum]